MLLIKITNLLLLVRVTKLCWLFILPITYLTHLNFATAQSNFHVVIDPGHGGKDNGCTGDHSIEKHITLDIAYKLQQALSTIAPHIHSSLTRHDDTFLPLLERANFANNQNASLFISLHCNHVPEAYVSGAESYVLGEDSMGALGDLEARENYYVGKDLQSSHAEVDDILFQARIQQNLKESITVASLVNKHIDAYSDIKARSIKQANFIVLKGITMPGILLEAGFLSNTTDESILLTDSGKTQVAQAIAKAIQIYEESLQESPYVSATYTQPSIPEAYTIQIASTKHIRANMTRPEWNSISSYDLYLSDDGIYKYTFGEYTSAEAAIKAREDLYYKGFKGACVIDIASLKSDEKLN